MSSLIPKLVGEITVKQRKPRYDGEPVYKTLSFIRQKPKKTERVEIVRYVPAGVQVPFWEHPQWYSLTVEQQDYIIKQYQNNGSRPKFHKRPIEVVPAPPLALPGHRGHHDHQQALDMAPEVKLIAPKPKPKLDTGYAIFDDSDTETTITSSSRTSFGSSKSNKSSHSSSSTRSRSSRYSGNGPVTGW